MFALQGSANASLFIIVLNREVDHDNLPGIYPAE